MLERVWLSVAFAAATSVSGLACDVSEAGPSLPAPAKRDAGMPTDAAVVDAATLDASSDAGGDAPPPRDAGVDARPLIDGGVRRRTRPPRDAGVVVDAGAPTVDAGAPTVDAGAPPADAAVMDAPLLPDAATVDGRELDAHDILRDSGEAPPLNDASILGVL
jgi:hypothetical protein